ncbi:TPA: nucleoid-associated protein [Serratia marcescens]
MTNQQEQEEILIHHLVIHVMNKKQHAHAELEPSPDEKAVRDASRRLIKDITTKYSGRAGKGYGRFEDDRDSYPMGNIADDYYVSKRQNFYDISLRMLNHLSDRANSEQMSTGGYVLITHIESDSKEYLLVALLTATIGSTVRNFDVEDSEYLDISKLRVAGRIDLTSWTEGRERYISFLKGQNSVSAYFKKFLGCNDILIAKKETEKLRDALREFVHEQNLEGEDKEEFLNQAHTQLQSLSKTGTPFDILTFANELWPSNPEILLEKLSNDELQLSDGFVPDGKVIRDLVSFKGKSRHWTLKFDREALVDGSVTYDKENDRLLLSQIPEPLRNELLAETDEEEIEEDV